MIKPNITAIILASAIGILMLPSFSSDEESWPYKWSNSVADSKKLGRFLFEVKPRPARFSWCGHQVDVYEAWRERCKTVDYLMFKLKIDNDNTKEQRILKENGLVMSFLHEGAPGFDGMKGINSYGFYPLGPFGPGEMVHYVRLDNEKTSEIKLRVGSFTKDQTVMQAKPSETVLDFELTSPKVR